MAVVALKPRQYSFTDHAVSNPAAPPPGDRLDGEVDRIDKSIAQIIDWVGVSLNSDGTLKTAPATASAPRTLTSTGVLGPQAGTHLFAGADPNAQAQDWSEVSFEWAEHMPDTIPPNILATMGITGDHWSARWWAHRALEIAAEVGAVAGGVDVTVSDTAPSSPATGKLWWCTSDAQLYVFYDDLTSSQWVVANNPAPPPPPVAVVPAAPASVFAPVSGATIVLADARPVYVNNLATLAALTIRLPVVPAGTLIEIGFRSPVTALTLQDNLGTSVPNAPVSAYGPGAALEMRFEAPGWIYWK